MLQSGFTRALCVSIWLVGGALAAAPALAQDASAPLPMMTPAQPTIAQPTVAQPTVPQPTVAIPTAPAAPVVVGTQPAPTSGVQSVAPGAGPVVNPIAAPVATSSRQLIRPETESRPVVVELFTSQGCSSCPPADSYLGQLARRKDVLPLSYHVDYWDYIGWKDQFADPAYVGRQRAYAMTLGHHMVYTPQVVVAGAVDAQGADRAFIEQKIREAKARQRMYPLEVARDPQTGQVLLQLPEAPLPVPATIWLVTYQYKDEAAIDRGVNSGRTLDSFNTVRSLQKVAVWNGHAATVPLQLDAKAKAEKPNACAVFANLADYGPIVAAVAFDFDDAW
ncbi:MAG TPA: DUF1223 domain-containing protein [Dongiaceae bacterium]|jgi:hypothetical protein|nr:DUF1223 domain-containing protein [Dongiaceae bacterium]